MNVLDAVVLEMDERIAQLKDHLASGRLNTHEEYRQLCGEIKGLLFCRQNILDLKQKMEHSDDE